MALAHGRLKKGSSLGPYKIVRLIGEGGMGEVYEARDEILDRQVALKVVLPELSSAAEVIKRFTSEGQTLAKLNHQNVVTVHTLGEDKGIHYIVMEFVDGVSLWDLLQAKGNLEINQALHYFNQLLSGIKALHDHKIIHRDIKPKNIIVRRDNSVKIVDFGIAKVKGQQEREITQTGAIIGSVYYISPECLEGEQASVQSDIWSLGVNLYEMLMGQRPFQDDHRTRLIEKITTQEISFAKDKGKVPEGLQKIILKMCEKKALDRYASVADIQRDIEAFKNSGYLRIPKTDYVATVPSTSSPILKPFDRPVVPVSIGTKSLSFGRGGHRVSAVSSVPKVQPMHVAAFGLAVLVIGGVAFMKLKSPSAETVVDETIESLSPQYPIQEQVLWVSDQSPLQIQWSGAASASDTLEVAKDRHFRDVVAEIQYPQSPQTIHPRAGQNFDDGKYFWRIVRKRSEESKPLFEPLAFTILTTTAPSLSYPASHMNFPDSKPVNIYWQEKTGAQNYRVEVAEDPRFKKNVVVQIVRETKFSLDRLQAGTYYWRVRAEEPSGTSNWAEPRNFNIQKSAPPAMAQTPPQAPSASAVGLMGLMNSASTAKPEPPKKVKPAPVAPPPTLKAVKKPAEKKPASVPKKKEVHQPRVKGKKVTEATVVAPTVVEAAPSAPSAPAPVVATPLQPAPTPAPAAPTRAVASVGPEKVKLAIPKLKLPPDGASIVTLGGSQSPISFKWEAIEEAEQYRLEVSTNEKFSKIVHRSIVKENSMVLTKALPAGKLFWRLRSEKGTTRSGWSPIYSFEITK